MGQAGGRTSAASLQQQPHATFCCGRPSSYALVWLQTHKAPDLSLQLSDSASPIVTYWFAALRGRMIVMSLPNYLQTFQSESCCSICLDFLGGWAAALSPSPHLTSHAPGMIAGGSGADECADGARKPLCKLPDRGAPQHGGAVGAECPAAAQGPPPQTPDAPGLGGPQRGEAMVDGEEFCQHL